MSQLQNGITQSPGGNGPKGPETISSPQNNPDAVNEPADGGSLQNPDAGGALARLGAWQVFVLALLMVGGGGYMVHVGTLPVWALLLAVGAYLLGVGAVVKLLAAVAEVRSHVAASISDAVLAHRQATQSALETAATEARVAVQSHTAAVTQTCGKLLLEMKENTGLTQTAVERLNALQKGRRK